MKKILLKWIAVVLFVINAFVLVESAMSLGAVIDSLIAGDFELFKMSIILLTVYSVLSFILPVIGYQIAYYVSFEEMNRLKAAKFASDVMMGAKETDLSEYSQNIDLIYSGVLMNKWNFLNIASVFVFTAIKISSLSILLFLIAFVTSALPLLIPLVLQNSLKEKSSQFLDGSKEYVSFVKDKLGGRGELIRYKGVKWAVGKHDVLYAEKGAGELWGVDLSQKQLDNAGKLLSDSGYSAKLLCSRMEDELDVPKGYFDYVYSIYGIGWTTDLQGTFDKIASYLKKGGIFIFSWHHTLNYCIAWSCDERKDVFEDEKLVMMKSYYDESYFKMPVHDSEIILCNRKMSTYINALAKAGFVVEQLVEESDNKSLNATGDVDPKTKKAKMLPISFCIKARKL